MFLRIRGGVCLGRWTSLRNGQLKIEGLRGFSQCARSEQEKSSNSKHNDQTTANPLKQERDDVQNKQQAEQKEEKVTLLEEQKKHEQRKHGQQQKKSGFGVPALAVFAVGFPLGWYLSDYRPFGKASNGNRPSDFIQYTLASKDIVSSTAAIFRLKPSSNAAVDLDDPNLERAITSVEFKQPQLQIARSYTCLPQEYGQHMDELRFLIRRERKGEVSNYLHRLPTGAEIDVRGLYPEYILPEDVESVAFLVGGTGIAPAMQAADILAANANVHILWSSRRREDCIGGYNDTKPTNQRWSFWPSSAPPQQAASAVDLQNVEKGALVSILESLKKRSFSQKHERSRLLVHYFVDEEGSFVKAEDVKHMLSSLSRASGESQTGRKILFVSGPEGFLSHWAGSKQWADGREVQGPLRGVLSTLDLNGWEVVKL